MTKNTRPRRRWVVRIAATLAAATCSAVGVLVALAMFSASGASQTNVFTAGSVGSGQQPTATVSGRDVTLNWSAATNATSYTAARSNVSPQSLSTTLNGSCASSVASTGCVDVGAPENGGSATNWTYTDTPHLNSWNGPTSPASATVTVPAPALSLVSTTFTADGGSTNATASNFFDNEGVTYCLDSSTTPCTGVGTATIPASGGSTTSSITIPAGTSVGGHTVYAVGASGSLASKAITVSAGAATQLVFTTQPVGGVAEATNFTTSPTVSVEDAHNNVVTSDSGSIALAVNTYSAGNGGSNLGTLTCSNAGFPTVTASSGQVAFTNCQISGTAAAGTYTFKATRSGLTTATSNNVSIVAGAASKLLFTTQPVGGVAEATNFTTSPTVSVEDANGNIVTGDTGGITLAVNTYSAGNGGSNLGTLACSNTGFPTVAASSGQVAFTNCQISGTAAAGTYSFKATRGGLTTGTSNNVSIVAGAATQLAFSTQPAGGVAEATNFTTSPTVSVEDTNGNLVAGDNGGITLAINTYTAGNGGSTQGTLTCSNTGFPTVTASSGQVAFTHCQISGTAAAGTYTLKASRSGLTTGTSSNVSIVAGAASKLLFTTQPVGGVAEATNFTTSPTVSVEDANGNVVTGDGGSISLAINTYTAGNGGTTQGTLTCSNTGFPTVTASSGQVAFTSCQISGTAAAGTYTFKATRTGLTTGTSTSVTITAGTATQLVFTTQPVAGASGSPFSTQPVVKVEDSANNVVTGSSQTITLVASGGTLSSCAGLTASSGVITVSGCTFAGAVGTNYTLTAQTTTAPVVSGTSANFSPSTFGTATQIVLSGSTNDLPIGSTRQLTATIEDSAGNTVTTGADSSASITFAKTAGTGTVTGLASAAAASGVATDTVTGATAGSVTLRASGTINGSSTNSGTLTFTVDAVNSVDLYTEVQQYNSTHTSNSSSSHGTTDFTFYSGAKNDQGGSVSWTAATLTDALLNYTASSTTNGKWSDTNAGPMGPFTSSPFNGVSVTPGPTNSGGNQGYAAVAKLTVPAAPTGSYQSGATIQVQAAWTSGTGSSVWVYLLDSTGAAVGGSTNPVQVQSGSSMNTTFSIATPSTSTVYYVAVAPTSSTSTTATLDITAALPYH